MVDDEPTTPRKQIPAAPADHKFDPYTGKPIAESTSTTTDAHH